MRARYGAWAARWRVPLGFAFAIAYVVLSQPTRTLLIGGCLVALAGLALRGAAAGHIEKNQSLATSGPFRYSRNPLYLGTLILGSGFMIAGNSYILGLAFIVLFLSIYFPVMQREEQFLRQKFGAEYEAYARRTALFLPRRARASVSGAAGGAFSWRRYVNNREYEAAAGWAVISLFLVVKLALR